MKATDAMTDYAIATYCDGDLCDGDLWHRRLTQKLQKLTILEKLAFKELSFDIHKALFFPYASAFSQSS